MGKVSKLEQAAPEIRAGHDFPPDDSIAPMVAVGGLLTVKRVAEWYRPMLSQDDLTDVSTKDRFIPPPYRGIAPPEKMRAKLTDELERLYERFGGKKMYLVGHSLGALLSTMTAYERPDLVAGVSCLGGAHLGIKRHTAASWGLQTVLGNPKEAELLEYRGPFIQEHKERMKEEWPEGVPLQIISTSLDAIIPPPHGYQVELPRGEEPAKKLVVPRSPGAGRLIKRIMRIPEDVELLPSGYVTEHINLPRASVVKQAVDLHRRGLAVTPIESALPNSAANLADLPAAASA